MSQKNSIYLKKSTLDKSNDNFNSKNPHSKREDNKLKLVKKFKITPQEAEKVLMNLEKIDRNNPSNNAQNNIKNRDSKKLINNASLNNNENIPQQNLEKEDIFQNVKSDKTFKINKQNQNLNKIEQSSESKNDEQYPIIENKDVDSILENIIPNYNKQISIEVNHVSLTFEVQNEKTDTLKESFIKTLKRNKKKTFKINALKDITFKIYKGEKIGIIGYNGAGKSTLLNVITGIYPPDKGEVITRGNISPLLSLGSGFDLNFSGRRNIFLNGAVLGYDKKYLETKLNEIIEFSELGEFIDIPIKNYSSGMMVKLAFSIATAVDPDILIIDEILGVGDVNFSKKSRDKMKSLMDGGTTVLLVSHSIPQVRELCDKAIWIDKGAIKEIGEVNKVCDHYLKDAEKASNEELANIKFR